MKKTKEKENINTFAMKQDRQIWPRIRDYLCGWNALDVICSIIIYQIMVDGEPMEISLLNLTLLRNEKQNKNMIRSTLFSCIVYRIHCKRWLCGCMPQNLFGMCVAAGPLSHQTIHCT